ncbi:MAG: DUF4397 domain-containing protein [Deltaproteobacteria bacterium]|nr:DUF4397 domain-containing protein [Deltaproteobacteria bacterium]
MYFHHQALAAGLVVALGSTLLACSSDDSSSPAAMGGMGGSAGSDAGGDSAAGAGGSAGASGTGGSKDGGMGGAAGSDAGTKAMLRVVHASPTAPAVDLYVKGSSTPVASGLQYGKSTSYLEVPAGTYDIEIRAAGASPSDPPAFEVTGLALADGAKYTAVAAGDLASTNADDKFRVLPLEEKFEAAAAGKVRLRIVHAGFDAPTVDLDVGNDDPTKPEISAVARFADTGAAGVELPAAQALQVGIASASSTVTAFSAPPLPEGVQAFVIATGELKLAPRDDKGFALLAVLPDSTTVWLKQNPFVYALHASPDAPAVDIYAGAAEVFDNVAFGQMGRIQVPPSDYTLDFFAGQAGPTPKPAGAPAASAKTPKLEAGGSYLAIATGLLAQTGEKAFQLVALAEGFDVPDSGKTRVRVVHASPDAPAVDLGTVTTAGTLDPSPPITNLSFPGATDAMGLALPATALTLGLAATGSLSTVKEFAVALPDGGRLFAIAAGMLSPAANQPPLQLLVVNASSTSILDKWTVASVPAK